MIVYSVSAEGIENDLGTLYQHVSQLTEVQSIALRRFERTGFIGAEGNKVDRFQNKNNGLHLVKIDSLDFEIT